MVTLPQHADEILNRLERIGLVRAGVPVRPEVGASINTVWRVATVTGTPAMLRVGPSPREVAAGPSWLRGDALACEAIAIDHVRTAAGNVPVPIAAGFRERDRPWLLQTLVDGRPLAGVLPAMTPVERQGIHRAIGAMLRRVHDMPVPWFGAPDGRRRFPDWSSMVRDDAEGLRDDARRFGLDPAPFDRLLAEVDVGAAALGQITTPAMVHSDLDPRHIFVREDGAGWRIAGVIDWEYARHVDPFSESLLVDMLARPASDLDRAALLAGYGLPPALLDDDAFQQRQAIYRGIAEGWALTDAARLDRWPLFKRSVDE